MNRQTLTFLTPCFCRGQNPIEPELRVPSLRGQLRFWARVLSYDLTDADASARFEHQLFGGIRGKKLKISANADSVTSRYVCHAIIRGQPNIGDRYVCPHDPTKRTRPAFLPRTEFDVMWETSRSAGNGAESDFLRVLKAWALLGSLGARVTRAAGSVWRFGWTPTENAPTEKEFLRQVAALWPRNRLPGHVRVKVLRLPTEVELNNWNLNLTLAAKAALLNDEVEKLRAIATDTIQFGNQFEGAFGYGGADGRKASPLKIKLGLFESGYRLIAIQDRRNDRHGESVQAVQALAKSGKPLGALLKDAGFSK